jgi:hypothetical protein
MAALCGATTGFPVHQLFGDALDSLPDSGFDAITALWNVFGHMENSEVRLRALRHMRAKLTAGGCIMLDVNNRHNQLAYGRVKVLGRRVIDTLAFDEKRGDAHYEWKIGAKSYPASGHLFTPGEMARLFSQAEMKVAERYTVNYNSGEVSILPFNGQLFFRLEPT